MLKKFIGLRRLSSFSYFGTIHFWNLRQSRKFKKNTKVPYRSRFKVVQGHRCW